MSAFGAAKAGSARDDASEELRAVFESYCAFGATTAAAHGMTSFKLMKVVKDAALLDKRLTRTDVDLVFTRHCPKGANKLRLADFVVRLCDDLNIPHDAKETWPREPHIDDLIRAFVVARLAENLGGDAHVRPFVEAFLHPARWLPEEAL